MTSLNDYEILELLDAGESDRVSFKEAVPGGTIREDVCAFSNDLPDHREPGVVFVGVRDDGTFSGLPITDELLRTLADIKTDGNTLPPPSMVVQKRLVRGNEVAVVVVQPSDSPPVRYRGRIHIWIGTRKGIANAQDERILNEKRRFRDIPFDVHPVPTAELSDLDLTRFNNEYLPQAFARDILDANERSINEQLAATKMVGSEGEPTPTVLGLLVLGKNPQDFIPGAYVQFLKLAGIEITDDIIDNQDYRGVISDVIHRLDEKLLAHNRTSVDFTSGPIERRTSLYPIAAIQQITRNAVMHRTYEATNAPVRIHWFDDRIEVISPGEPFGAVTAANFGKGDAVDYRNPNLADAMKTLGFVQRFGVGIHTARRLLQDAGHPDPIFTARDNFAFVEIRYAI